eukprot:5713966-Alexandrium_andersonii.AAC.1
MAAMRRAQLRGHCSCCSGGGKRVRARGLGRQVGMSLFMPAGAGAAPLVLSLLLAALLSALAGGGGLL